MGYNLIIYVAALELKLLNNNFILFSIFYRYDFHFIVNALGTFGDKIKSIKVVPYNSENFRTLSFNSFEFLDSLSFLQAPLAQLSHDLKEADHDYKILKQTYLVQTNGEFDQSKYDMVLEKSFFPYELCQNVTQMNSITKFPKREDFYSCLSEETISESDHKFAKSVWKKFNCKNLLDYTKVYCKIDTILLAEIFQKFREEMIKFSGLDPVYYMSLPAYSYDSMLKLTKTVISLPTDINMIHFLESGRRGGMSFIGTRYLKASTKVGEETEIHYIDANNVSKEII